MSTLIKPAAQAHPAHGLTETDIALASAAARRLPGAWCAAAECDYAGNIIVVLMPDGDDAAGPSFHIERGPGGVSLGAVRWDAFTPLGIHPGMAAALDAVARHLDRAA